MFAGERMIDTILGANPAIALIAVPAADLCHKFPRTKKGITSLIKQL